MTSRYSFTPCTFITVVGQHVYLLRTHMLQSNSDAIHSPGGYTLPTGRRHITAYTRTGSSNDEDEDERLEELSRTSESGARSGNGETLDWDGRGGRRESD